VIIRDYLWLFGFWASSRLVVCFIPKSLRMEQLGDGCLSPAKITACESCLLPAVEATYQSTTLFSRTPTSTRRALWPVLPAKRYWTQPSRNFWRYPAPSSRISFAIESRWFTHVLSGISLSIRTCNNQNNHNHCNNHKTLILVFWLATFSACSALLKPKCQKMSSTRCSIFSLKR